MNDVVIRKYTDADHINCVALCQELAEHHADIYDVPHSILRTQGAWLDELLQKDGFAGFWLAEVQGVVLGMCGLIVSGLEGEIEPIVVSSTSRNKGIGTSLINHVIQEAKIRKVRYLSIRPVARNEEAIALFIRLGFNLVGSIDLFQDLEHKSDRTWKSGLTIFGHKVGY